MKMKILKGHCKFCHLTSLFLVTIFVFYNTQSVNAQEVKLSVVDINNKANKLFADENYVEAVKWYRLAAEQGYSLAQYALGRCYASGYGVEENDSEAVKWYTLAAEQDSYYDAQYYLGLCYEKGRGVDKNLEEAVKWYKLADADGLNTSARKRLNKKKFKRYL